jgi:phenylpropionate dioxygenase-like ring-hydroxylating dioxygenase large terminal subunit
VHVLESINPSRPHAVELLGKQLVLWRAGSAAAAAGSAGPATSSSNRARWQCFENACPHRCGC